MKRDSRVDTQQKAVLFLRKRLLFCRVSIFLFVVHYSFRTATFKSFFRNRQLIKESKKDLKNKHPNKRLALLVLTELYNQNNKIMEKEKPQHSHVDQKEIL